MERITTNEQQTISELREIRAGLWKKAENYERCVVFANDLKGKHPDFIRYKLYHLLIGSTPTEFVTEFDFPGEDSIERFIRSF